MMSIAKTFRNSWASYQVDRGEKRKGPTKCGRRGNALQGASDELASRIDISLREVLHHSTEKNLKQLFSNRNSPWGLINGNVTLRLDRWWFGRGDRLAPVFRGQLLPLTRHSIRDCLHLSRRADDPFFNIWSLA